MRRRVVVAVAFAIVAAAFTIAAQEPAIPVTLALIIDLKGAFASPGFNDAHVHVDGT